MLRLGFVHYNTAAEVDRTLDALERHHPVPPDADRSARPAGLMAAPRIQAGGMPPTRAGSGVRTAG